MELKLDLDWDHFKIKQTVFEEITHVVFFVVQFISNIVLYVLSCIYVLLSLCLHCHLCTCC